MRLKKTWAVTLSKSSLNSITTTLPLLNTASLFSPPKVYQLFCSGKSSVKCAKNFKKSKPKLKEQVKLFTTSKKKHSWANYTP